MTVNPCCENSALKLSVTNRTCVSYIIVVNHMGAFYWIKVSWKAWELCFFHNPLILLYTRYYLCTHTHRPGLICRVGRTHKNRVTCHKQSDFLEGRSTQNIGRGNFVKIPLFWPQFLFAIQRPKIFFPIQTRNVVNHFTIWRNVFEF